MPSNSRIFEKDFRLSLRLGRRRALDGLSLSVLPGEIYGFLGPNGAGKTTSIKILVSLLRQDSGTATIFGAEPDPGKDAAGRSDTCPSLRSSTTT